MMCKTSVIILNYFIFRYDFPMMYDHETRHFEYPDVIPEVEECLCNLWDSCTVTENIDPARYRMLQRLTGRGCCKCERLTLADKWRLTQAGDCLAPRSVVPFR